MQRSKSGLLRRLRSALAILVWASGAAAQASAPGVTLAEEMAKARVALENIVTVLEQRAGAQDLDVLMKRVQIAATRLTSVESALRAAQADWNALETERSGVELRLGQLRLRAESGGEGVRPMFELMAESTETERKRVLQRMIQLTQEIAARRAELDRRRDELADWQRVLDRRLASLAP